MAVNVQSAVERQLRQQLVDLDARYQEDFVGYGHALAVLQDRTEELELLESLYQFQVAENANLHAAHRRELELLRNAHLAELARFGPRGES